MTVEQIIQAEQCFSCGNDLDNGFIEREIDGQNEFVCGACATEDERDIPKADDTFDPELEAYYAAGDAAFTMQFEESL